jgi:hypothetical protein
VDRVYVARGDAAVLDGSLPPLARALHSTSLVIFSSLPVHAFQRESRKKQQQRRGEGGRGQKRRRNSAGSRRAPTLPADPFRPGGGARTSCSPGSGPRVRPRRVGTGQGLPWGKRNSKRHAWELDPARRGPASAPLRAPQACSSRTGKVGTLSL